MAIPQSQINDLPTLTNLAANVDSSSDAIDILQILDAVLDRGTGKKYYDSAGDFPLADSSTEGQISQTFYTNPDAISSTHEMYVSTQDKWKLFYTKGDLPAQGPSNNFQGAQHGYMAGGAGWNPATSTSTAIVQIPFSSSTPILSTFGNITTAKNSPLISSQGFSDRNGANGYVSYSTSPTNVGFDKFPFVSGGTAVTTGGISPNTGFSYQSRHFCVNSETDGFILNKPSAPQQTYIRKYPFASSTVAEFYGGSLFTAPINHAGMNACQDHGSGYAFFTGANRPNPITVNPFPVGTNSIKFSYTSIVAAAVGGALTPFPFPNHLGHPTNISAEYYGYACNSFDGTLGTQSSVWKFPFAAGDNLGAYQISNLTSGHYRGVGMSGYTKGYVSGSFPYVTSPSTEEKDVRAIDYATDNTSSATVLSFAFGGGSGLQY